jgi:hypothetical protein
MIQYYRFADDPSGNFVGCCSAFPCDLVEGAMGDDRTQGVEVDAPAGGTVAQGAAVGACTLWPEAGIGLTDVLAIPLDAGVAHGALVPSRSWG